MKKAIVILVVLLMAATAFSQTSKRPANTRETAGNKEKVNVECASSSARERNASNSWPVRDHAAIVQRQPEHRLF